MKQEPITTVQRYNSALAIPFKGHDHAFPLLMDYVARKEYVFTVNPNKMTQAYSIFISYQKKTSDKLLFVGEDIVDECAQYIRHATDHIQQNIINAAPELFDALKELMASVDALALNGHSIDSLTALQARKAINKAKGLI